MLIVVIIGITRYGRLNTPFKILALSTIANLVIDILSDIFNAKYKNNASILHVEAITEFIFFSLVFYYLFTSQITKKVITVLIIAASVFSVINALFLQPFHTVFPTYVNLPTLALLVIFSLLLFKQMLLSPLTTPLLKQGVFWFNTAIIFYGTTMFLNIGLSNVYIKNPSTDYLIFYFWYIILYIFTILIGIALLTDDKEINSTNAL
ncbi:MAG: hypothetical protein JWR02_2037 [Mucilaginibacter sp.]|nr:hypothetical protein [Mucilaginibacter sp.]